LRILIPLASQQKGFFISLGRKLATLGHKVYFAPRDKDVETLIRRLAPEIKDENIIVEEEFSESIPLAEAVQRGLEVEKKYDVRLSMLLSYDRALGRGYIFNADRYPQIGRAFWGHERKLASILEAFNKAERILDRCSPDFILGHQKQVILNTVASKRGVTYLSPSSVKVGNRYIWSDNPFFTSTYFLEALRENAEKLVDDLPPVNKYVREAGSKYNHSRLNFSWQSALLRAGRLVFNDSKKLIRGSRKRASYRLFGWIPPVLRQPANYRFFLRRGIRPSELEGKRAVYVPLHLEPEIALLALSPEFNNSMEMIAWISKAAPADTLVVVKEQPFSFGVRSRRYYEQLMQIGNVFLAHPETTSWEWIRATNVTATITGTAATEAVVFGRPVLSFGRHQAVNLLPTARLATDYEFTKSGLDELLDLNPEAPAYEHSRRALFEAQMRCSFELPGFARASKSAVLQDNLAERAFVDLVSKYPKINAYDKR